MMAFTKNSLNNNYFGKKAVEMHSFGQKISHNRYNDSNHQNDEPKEKPKQTIEKK